MCFQVVKQVKTGKHEVLIASSCYLVLMAYLSNVHLQSNTMMFSRLTIALSLRTEREEANRNSYCYVIVHTR